MKVGTNVTIKQGLSTQTLHWWAVINLTNSVGKVIATDKTSLVDVRWPSGLILLLPIDILQEVIVDSSTDIEDNDDNYKRAMRIL